MVTQSGPHAVQRLYDAFRAGDGDGMQDCYAPGATFRDPVFELRGADRIGAMWKMLLAGGSDLEVEASGITSDGVTGSAHWEARYTFSTGRRVHNVIDATFRLEDDRIALHVDRFGFWRWSRQALGAPGLLLGWSPVVRGKVQRTAARSLDRFQAGS
ncbi:MAG: nuclear transport factor 2 family protein [Actinobacteria bacterium]|nr:nuclear transport factor 2 family protein [Actinomycetota bacterium]